MMFAVSSPYALLLKLGLAAGLLAIAFLGGCHVQSGRDAGKVLKLQGALQASARDLGDARDSLRTAASTFKQISAQTRANADAAAKQIALGETLAKQAKTDKAMAQARVAALEQQLKAERSSCVDAGRRVCGIPLQ